MTEKFFVFAFGSSTQREYGTLTVMKLPGEQAEKKADLDARIKKQVAALNKEFTFPPPENWTEHEWDREHMRNHERLVGPLLQESDAIKGPLEHYYVKSNYEVGQVLDKLPDSAIPTDNT
jgi:hypothetical protein